MKTNWPAIASTQYGIIGLLLLFGDTQLRAQTLSSACSNAYQLTALIFDDGDQPCCAARRLPNAEFDVTRPRLSGPGGQDFRLNIVGADLLGRVSPVVDDQTLSKSTTRAVDSLRWTWASASWKF